MIESWNASDLMMTQIVQVTIVAVVAWLSWRLVATNRPHFAHAIWCLVLIKCLTPPIFYSPTSPFSWNGTQPQTASVSASDVQHARDSPFAPTVTYETELASQNTALAVVPQVELAEQTNWGNDLWKSLTPIKLQSLWMAGAAIGLGFLVLRYAIFCLRLRSFGWTSNIDLEEQVAALCERLSIRRTVRLRVVDHSVGPAVMGLFRPVILLPAVLVCGKTPQQLELLLAHELIHIRRGDLWWSLLQAVAKSLWWFHPLVWLSGRMLSGASEQSCDEETVSELGCKPSRYARTLLEVLEIKHELRAVPALPGVRPIELTSKRMERIMSLGKGSHGRCPKWVWVFMLAVGACILPGAAMVGAQKPDAELEVKPGVEVTSVKPKRTSADEGAFSVRVYHVAEALEKIQEAGVDKQEAAEKLLLMLPSETIFSASTSSPKSDGRPVPAPVLEPIATPDPVDAAPRYAPNPIGKTKLTYDGKNLIVRANGTTHDAIADSIAHIRDFGVMQVVIEMTVVELREENPVQANYINGTGLKPATPEKTRHAAYAKAASPRATPFGTAPFGTAPFGTTPANDVTRMIQARLANGTASILSRPRVITTNGCEASISVGAHMPITETTDGKSAAVGTVDVGFKAELMPRLLGENQISIKLESSTRHSTGKSNRTVIRSAEGKEVSVRETPGVITKTVSTDVTCPLDEYVLIDGPSIDAKTRIVGLHEASSKSGKLVIVAVCHAINPFDDKLKKVNSNSPTPIGNPTPVKPVIGKANPKPNERITKLQVGNFVLEMKGGLEIVSGQKRVVVQGKQASIKFFEPDAKSDDQWLTLAADQIYLTMNPGGGDSEESIREARLQGRVSLQFNEGQRLTAESLVLVDGVSIVSATKISTQNSSGMRFQADRLQMDRKTRATELTGNVVMVNNGTTLRAERVKFDPSTDKILAMDMTEVTFGDPEE